MQTNRRVYLLDNQKLKPETIAVTFAKTSRSPQSFDQIATELSDEKSAQFHERWVVGYGHASVSEHAVLHIAIENISRLAAECLESNRLASYTEKSSRYQVWDEDCLVIPPEIKGNVLEPLYCQTMRTLFSKYKSALSILYETLENKAKHQGEAITERELRSKCMDACRYYLPAAATANVGVTINARSLEHALRKMLSHPLQEVHQLGEEIKQVASEQLPTLLKYVDAVPYWQQAEERTSAIALAENNVGKDKNWCTLIDYDEQYEKHILTSLIVHYGQISYGQAEKMLESFSNAQVQTLLNILFGKLETHDTPLRELEYSNFIFDLLMDQGAYYEFKRHRMMTQSAQPLSPYHGYAIPKLISAAGLDTDYREAMELANSTYQEIKRTFPAVAAYVIPNGYNRRILASFNLRSAIHFISLRTAPNAHFAIRRIANRLAEEIKNTMQLFKPYFCVESLETWQSIEKDYFSDPIHY